MADCNHDCSSCGQNCSDRDMTIKLNEKSNIKKIIGVISAKGGVGKSLISSLLACSLKKKGYEVGILDADITGPSIPKSFGLKEKAYGEENLIYPIASHKLEIDIISSSMLLEKDDDPIIWRGSLISNLVSQFYGEVLWKEKEYLVIDMPPGTGDVALTAFQSIPLDGIVIVTSPQDLVTSIVKKAINMANLMNIKIYGVVENMSYVQCPDCNKKIYLYGESKTLEELKQYNIPLLAQLPINPELTQMVDKGEIESFENNYLDEVIKVLEEN